MGRRLPDPIEREEGETDEEFEERRRLSKRRLQLFKRVYQSYYRWESLREMGEMDDVLALDGDEFYLGDMLTGIDTLPKRQREAFELICLEGYTESETRDVLLPNSTWSTPVQQYSDDGLKKMVIAYDAKQAGTWDPVAAMSRKRAVASKKEEVKVTVVDAPEVPEEKPSDKPAGRVRTADHWDFTKWSDSHESLANFINEKTALGITPAQVKAVSFLRQEWYNSPETIAERERVREERRIAKDKYAHETPEQRRKRQEAARKLKSMERAAQRVRELQDQVRQLRIEAGLNPDTGEPYPASQS